MDEEKKQYSKINKEIRQEIIDKICIQKKPLLEVFPQFQIFKKVAQEYSLLASTCKSIVNTYMKEGRVGKKESRIRKLKKVVTTYHIILNPLQPLLSQVQIQKNVENCVEQSQKSRVETDEAQEENKQELQSLDLSIQQWTQSLLSQIQSLNQQYKDPQFIRQN
ncbi:unnamed protein product (macronuclear) [Paramecium tetraurelia]|uniref:Uncharacterized protein n=1 Tax=Paramecium tetraurelia TaxID=5888 RepID=A0DRY5_PARTE|nr:uncharacterized protein GSPATT00019506001 [Paramecium tetraurelia]CAK85802.1 unnamed protein product [Paramecium tetraurelia]|eukprot:XP_001453199.1 hypothetical protein (macronuclear) [Paramecium tetraurelia strain d4-2]